MDSEDAIVKPVVGLQPAGLGKRCLLVANAPDLDYLGRLVKSEKFESRRILMSRLYYGGKDSPFCFIGPFIGAPYAVILLESLIAWGIREVVFFGWCGAVSTEVKIGDVIIPDKALIDDGTSKSYAAPHASEAFPSDSMQKKVKSSCLKNKISFYEGPVWTTDAIFRETAEKVRVYQKKTLWRWKWKRLPCFLPANFVELTSGCILLVSDELSSFEWKPGFKNPVLKNRRFRVCEMIRSLWAQKSL